MVAESTIKKPKRSRFAQSRIDYIVFGNPQQVGKLLYDYGFVPPKSLEQLSEAVHELIRSKGRSVVADLVKLHPDREVILGLAESATVPYGDPKVKEQQEEPLKPEDETNEENKPSAPADKTKQKPECATCGKRHQNEDSYCGCNHAYNSYDDPGTSKDNLGNLELSELMVRYEVLSKQSLANPENKATADEATRIWNEIRERNQSQKKKEPLFSIGYKEAFIILSLTIIAGILVGWGVRVPRSIKGHD